LNSLGVATFLVDSFTGRGLTSVVNDQALLGRLVQVLDSFRALEVIAKHPGIDPGRIAAMGFSRGGQGVLYASVKRFQKLHGPDGVAFAAHIPFYPTCNTTFIDDENVADAPIRIFHGTADDYVPVAHCRSYVERLRKAGNNRQQPDQATLHSKRSVRGARGHSRVPGGGAQGVVASRQGNTGSQFEAELSVRVRARHPHTNCLRLPTWCSSKS
jgi:dienelactone hydrolase